MVLSGWAGIGPVIALLIDGAGEKAAPQAKHAVASGALAAPQTAQYRGEESPDISFVTTLHQPLP
jgi:hypothetical protein